MIAKPRFLASAAALLALASCTTPIQPGASGQYVEQLEREEPVTGLADVGQGGAASAAAYYSSDRGSRRGRNYGLHDMGRRW